MCENFFLSPPLLKVISHLIWSQHSCVLTSPSSHLPSHASLQVLLREHSIPPGLRPMDTVLKCPPLPHFCIRLWLCNPTSVSWTFSFKSKFFQNERKVYSVILAIILQNKIHQRLLENILMNMKMQRVFIMLT